MTDPDDRLTELANQLPWQRPDHARREAVRSSLLVAAAAGEGRTRTRWSLVVGAFATGALAAAAAVALIAMRSPSHRDANEPRAQVEASSAADFERTITQTSRGIDEVMRVRGGKLSLAVGAQPAGTRVHVATSDADVEGEGSYDVAVVDDTLREVDVKSGAAAVRVSGQQAVFLAAGQSWHAKVVIVAPAIEPTAPPAVASNDAPPPSRVATVSPSPSPSRDNIASPSPPPSPSPSPSPPPSPSPSPPPSPPPSPSPSPSRIDTQSPPRIDTQSPSPRSDVEQHFQAGWQLLKANQPAEAARELGAAADASGDAPLAADARYFQAVALVKAGRKTEAERAYVMFLDHAHDSLRRGRASIALARLIAERGDAKSARAWFEAALADSDPEVVRAAQAGIAALPH